MTKYVPFTYLLEHIPTGLKYYGSKTARNSRDVAHPSILWDTYFSSSHSVRNLIEIYGKESFRCEIRKTFETRQEALLWEQKVIRRMRMPYRQDWLNLNVPGPHPHMPCSDKTKKKISQAKTGRKHKTQRSDQYKKKMSLTKLGNLANLNTRKPVVLDGVRFESIAAAAKAHGVSSPTIRRWVKNPHLVISLHSY